MATLMEAPLLAPIALASTGSDITRCVNGLYSLFPHIALRKGLACAVSRHPGARSRHFVLRRVTPDGQRSQCHRSVPEPTLPRQ